jgi:hypothetical protein
MKWVPIMTLPLLASACATPGRIGPPPSLLDESVPVGFSPDVRLATADRPRYLLDAPRFFSEVGKAATDGTVDILSLSGGGSGGAFGAGALVGLSQRGQRPQYELVAGVSVGALIAPYAFLGPAWDDALARAFAGSAPSLRSPSTRSFLWGLLRFPRGEHPLAETVDRIVTPKLLDAIAQETAQGRHLVIATTDLDRQETILWDIGRIAEKGGEPARDLIKRVLLASVSVPGVYPPVLIKVSDRGRTYDELHADGSITTSLFAGPLAGKIVPETVPALHGANLYLIINGQLASRPRQTALRTAAILESTFSAAMNYKIRENVLDSIALAQANHMHLLMTEVPLAYPQANFLDFSPSAMQALFAFGERCAKAGRLWLTPEDSVKENLEHPINHPGLECPAGPLDDPRMNEHANQR